MERRSEAGSIGHFFGTGFNDYLEGFKYGSSLSFDVMQHDPDLKNPQWDSQIVSSFESSMFPDAGGRILALTTDLVGALAATVGVNSFANQH